MHDVEPAYWKELNSPRSTCRNKSRKHNWRVDWAKVSHEPEEQHWTRHQSFNLGRFNLIRALFCTCDITEFSRSGTQAKHKQTNSRTKCISATWVISITARPLVYTVLPKCNPDMQAQGRMRLLRAVNTRAKAIWKHLSTDFPPWTPRITYSSFIALVAAEAFTSMDYLSLLHDVSNWWQVILRGLPTLRISRKKGGIMGLKWSPHELDNNMQRKALTGLTQF